MKFFKSQAAEAAKVDFLIESLVNAGLATEEEIKNQEDPNWLKDKLDSRRSTKGPSRPTPSAGSRPSTVHHGKSDLMTDINTAWRASLEERRAALPAE